MKIRLDVASAVIAYVITRDVEMARLWFAIWSVK